jgi:hypothetical protein
VPPEVLLFFILGLNSKDFDEDETPYKTHNCIYPENEVANAQISKHNLKNRVKPYAPHHNKRLEKSANGKKL